MTKLPRMTVDKNWRPRNFIQRVAARIVARMFLEAPNATWQTFGEPWGGEPGCVFQKHSSLAQMVLRESGYDVCEATLNPPDLRKKGVS